jgi:hypothetical protein
MRGPSVKLKPITAHAANDLANICRYFLSWVRLTLLNSSLFNHDVNRYPSFKRSTCSVRIFHTTGTRRAGLDLHQYLDFSTMSTCEVIFFIIRMYCFVVWLKHVHLKNRSCFD